MRERSCINAEDTEAGHSAVHTNKKGALARPPICRRIEAAADDYLARLRIAAKPAIARSAASMIIAHSESVGTPDTMGSSDRRLAGSQEQDPPYRLSTR